MNSLYIECPSCRLDWEVQVTNEIRSLLSQGFTLKSIAKECGIDIHYWGAKVAAPQQSKERSE